MKKILSIVLALLMMFSFVGCVKRIEKDENGNVVVPEPTPIEPEKTYEELTLEEKMEIAAAEERVFVTSADCYALAPAKEPNGSNYGYINNFGEWVIEPKFSKAFNFNEGIAVVLDQYTDYEFIDKDGNKFDAGVPHRLTMTAARHFNEHYVAAVVGTGYEQTKIYLGIDGITKIGPAKLPLVTGVKYDTKEYFAVATPFIKGYAVGMRKTNESVLSQFKEDYKLISNKSYWQQACVIDGIGNVVAKLPAGYDVMDYSLIDNGTIIVKDITSYHKHYGLCNTEGDLIVPCDYHYIDYCGDGLYVAQNEKGFYGYINAAGDVIIDFIFVNAYPFSEGYAAVYEEDKWGIVDRNGVYAVEPSFDNVALLKNKDYDFNTGMAAVSGQVFAARVGDYWGLFDLEGNILDSTYAPDTEISPYTAESMGFVVFQQYEDGKGTGLFGLLDCKGDLALKPAFGDIGIFKR